MSGESQGEAFLTSEMIPVTKKFRIVRAMAGAAVFASILAVGFNESSAVVKTLWGVDYARPAVGLMWVWAHSTPIGALVGVVLGWALLLNRYLTQVAIDFLRVARWAPFLIWFPTVAMLGGRNFTTGWVWIWAGTTVALTACYELLIARAILKLPFGSSLGTVARAAILQGLSISLFLGMSLWIDVGLAARSGSPRIGSEVAMILAVAVLLINWSTGVNFRREAMMRGNSIIKELKNENWKSFAGTVGVVVVGLLSWEFVNGFSYSNSPREVLLVILHLFDQQQFFSDIAITFGEIFIGIFLSGMAAGTLLIDLDRMPRVVRSLVDLLLQVLQVAPIALLPDMFLFFPSEYTWSGACAAIFCLYPFARVFYGTQNETLPRRILLAVDEALPYGGAAIVYGQMMRATGGLVLFVAIAGATNQTAKLIAGFISLVLLIATLSIILRWLAKRGLGAPGMIGQHDGAQTFTS
jgi:ABC-type nitrate/sulfonate/bicarbonate transport system permease component